VQVLHQHHQGLFGARALQHPSHGLEHLELQAIGRLGRLQQVGQQRAERPAPSARPVDQPVGAVQLLHRPQQTQDRRERQPGLAHRDTEPSDDVHPLPTVGERRDELLDQGGLAEPCLTRDQDDPSSAGHRRLELGFQHGQLGLAAHQAGRRSVRGTGIGHEHIVASGGPARTTTAHSRR
jgi:hypothetical protein